MNINLFHQIFSLSTIPFFNKLAFFISYPFTYGLIFLILIWILFFSQRKMYNFSLLFLTGFFSWLIANILKNIIKINRPFIDLDIIPTQIEAGFSFPSQHMTVFTALAVAIFFINKKAGYVFILIAILIGLSRIIVGVHYPLDIVGGLFVGLLVGLFFIKIFKKI